MNKKIDAAINQQHHAVLPPSVLGILGGGQLGRMIANEAREMGYHIVVLDPTDQSPCGQVADQQIVAPFDSMQGAKQLAELSDVITYEFENIGAAIADYLEKESYLPQGYKLLYTTQNRLREKRAVQEAGVEVAPYHPVYTEKDLDDAIQTFGYPIVLKTAEGGYDGKGQLVIKDSRHLQQAKEQIVFHQQKEQSAPKEWVAEQFVPFQKEISVIVARNQRGEIQTFPAAENIHRNNILHLSIAPARISKETEEKAQQMAVQLAQHFQFVGLLAIEMFVLEGNRLFVNELAPRPHNSGHYTQQACFTSQFEQHVRAVCNLPLGDTQIRQPTVMVNILGEHVQDMLKRLPDLDATYKIHLYGKKEAKAGRKMGHLNVAAPHVGEAIRKIKELEIWNMEGIE